MERAAFDKVKLKYSIWIVAVLELGYKEPQIVNRFFRVGNLPPAARCAEWNTPAAGCLAQFFESLKTHSPQ